MQDRYLCRGKRIDNGEWVEGLLTIMWGQYHILDPDNENTAYPIEESTICQCTGLKDKNGKLIWENDIMEAHLDDKFPEDVTRVRVIWEKNGWTTSEPGADCREYLDDFDTENFEVVGNYIDNPELLEV